MCASVSGPAASPGTTQGVCGCVWVCVGVCGCVWTDGCVYMGVCMLVWVGESVHACVSVCALHVYACVHA